MLRKRIQHIFEQVQKTTACHQKCVITLTDIYKKTPEEEFLQAFLHLLQRVVIHGVDNAKYSKRCLNFASVFCADLTKKQTNETESHEFLTAVIEQILEWSRLNSYDVRYNCCYFLAQVLQDIGEEVQLEIKLIDEIQVVLLERMQETKIPVRLIAMAALVRLQDPQNFECPVIQAYMQACTSPSPQIRKESVERIAPNINTLPTIKERIKDVDPGVRRVAFHKCGDIGPLHFRIADKVMILQCGFLETNEKVKTTFIDYLLPKWLTAYQGNYLKFIEALKFLSLEEDFNKMSHLSRKIIQEFYSTHPINDLIEVLPINNEMLIDVENLSNSVTLFWNILTSILRKNNMDEYLHRILPELTPFCHYIDRIITTKSSEQMDEWRSLEYQFDLFNLLEIAENYDFTDEVGRRTMHSLTHKFLLNHHFATNLTKKLVSIAHKCSSNINIFTNDMCQIISDIREPLVAEPLTEDQRLKRDFKAAQIRVQINVLTEAQNEAINAREFIEAQKIDEKLANLNAEYAAIQSDAGNEKVRVIKSDNETLCQCLDILASVLELPAVNKLTPSLVTSRDLFLLPLISHNKAEVHSRVLKCLALFAVADKTTAEEYARILCIPIITYRAVPINNVSALTHSVCSLVDLTSLYGHKIVSEEEDTISKDDNTKRKLYSTSSEEELRVESLTPSSIFEIFLDMLDDERPEVRFKAVVAMTVMIRQGFTMTPSLLARILLKWYNPATERRDSRLQVCLGLQIEHFIQYTRCGGVIKETIIPTLTSIVRAPKTSPLVSIDVDNMLLFFSEMMNLYVEKEEIKNLSLDLYRKISENPSDRIVPLLVRLLYRLHFEQIDVTELIEHGEMCLENIFDKSSRRLMEKFLLKLKTLRAQRNNVTVDTTNQTEASQINEQVDDSTVKVHEKTTTPQPRKLNGKECVVLLENLTNCTQETTILHTIVEDSMEMEVDNNMTIESCTSESSHSNETNRNGNKSNAENEEPKIQSSSPTRPIKRNKERILSEPRKKRSKRNGEECIVLVQKINSLEPNVGTPRDAKKEENNMKKPQQIKRRKNRKNGCVVVLEDLKKRDHRILPLNVDVNIKTVVSESRRSRSRAQSQVVVSETSDSSDFSGDSESSLRRSRRCRKKRIVNYT